MLHEHGATTRFLNHLGVRWAHFPTSHVGLGDEIDGKQITLLPCHGQQGEQPIRLTTGWLIIGFTTV